MFYQVKLFNLTKLLWGLLAPGGWTPVLVVSAGGPIATCAVPNLFLQHLDETLRIYI
jgi:hypothetical protein